MMESNKVENPISQDRTKGTEREINVRQFDVWDIHIHIQIIAIKIKGISNMRINDVTIMDAQYAKMRHVKSKGVMATNEQRGSMLNN